MNPTTQSRPDASANILAEAADHFGMITGFDIESVWYSCPRCHCEQSAIPDFDDRFREVACCDRCGVVMAA